MTTHYIHGAAPLTVRGADERLSKGLGSAHPSVSALHAHVFRPFHAWQEWDKLGSFVHGAHGLGLFPHVQLAHAPAARVSSYAPVAHVSVPAHAPAAHVPSLAQVSSVPALAHVSSVSSLAHVPSVPALHVSQVPVSSAPVPVAHAPAVSSGWNLPAFPADHAVVQDQRRSSATEKKKPTPRSAEKRTALAVRNPEVDFFQMVAMGGPAAFAKRAGL